MDLVSSAVSGTSVYANGLIHVLATQIYIHKFLNSYCFRILNQLNFVPSVFHLDLLYYPQQTYWYWYLCWVEIHCHSPVLPALWEIQQLVMPGLPVDPASHLHTAQIVKMIQTQPCNQYADSWWVWVRIQLVQLLFLSSFCCVVSCVPVTPVKLQLPKYRWDQLPNTAHSCSQHDMATATLTSKQPGTIMPFQKHFSLLEKHFECSTRISFSFILILTFVLLYLISYS